VLEASELLVLARRLGGGDAEHEPTQAQLRRAASSAYYALFHHVLSKAAARFVGDAHRESAAYGIIYRSFDHGHMKRICEDLNAATLKDRMKGLLRRDSVSQFTKDFASNFCVLQETRHLADYDPIVPFSPSDVASLVDADEIAVVAFDSVPDDERADILALLMVRGRS
jgi:hypothetical protein